MEHLPRERPVTDEAQRELQQWIDDLFIESDREVVRILAQYLGINNGTA